MLLQSLSINESGKYYPIPSARTNSLKTSSTACAELVLEGLSFGKLLTPLVLTQ